MEDFSFCLPLVRRCNFCLPTAEPSSQRPRPADAGYQASSTGAWLQEPCPAASPSGGLDQGRRRAPGLAYETACSGAGGGSTGT